MRIILSCGCGDTTQFAKDAFRILRPDEEIPEVIEMDEKNKPLIKLFMLMLATEEKVDKFLSEKFAICVDVLYQMEVDIMLTEANESVAVYVKDLIKGCDLEL